MATASKQKPSGSRATGIAKRLIMQKILTEESYLEAKGAAKEDGKSLTAYLIEQNIVAANDIAHAASLEFGMPMLDLSALNLDMDVVMLVTPMLIEKHHFLPLYKRDKRLFIGVTDPIAFQGTDEVKFHTSFSVEPIVVEEDKLQESIKTALANMDDSLSDFGGDDIDLENIELDATDEDMGAISSAEVDDAPVVRFVNKMLLDAIKQGASDVHFEPYEKSYRVRYRQDGILREIVRPPVGLAGKLAARLKVMSRMDIAERRVPQDGRVKLRLSKNKAIDFRVNTCPTLFGEKVVLRILDPSSAKLGIDMLGYEPFQKEHYMNYLAKPYGMILVTGPTGSGKTVSLYTGLNILNTEDRNISTAEDPSEINLEGINQVNVNPKVGLTFNAALKAFLRQDPDVIMVGEIRDLPTAEIAIKAAQTGHLVLSTLHTNDAPKTMTRMVDMGVKPYAIASSVSLIIAQRLGRRLCKNCKTIEEIPKDILVQEGFSEQDIDEGFDVYAPVGCNQCANGYKGRVGIYQVMPVTEDIGRIILNGGTAVDIHDQSIKEGVWDLRRSALEKVKQGITGIAEINRVTLE
ncbi:MAG: type IV-A pilus assembly ATPase PilB [Gammaproteobacteria bacterium]|nr:type IV-A pilus assembly ATPase PilB [Gammaproteobacteria bacterium]NNM12831.1 type IV-A pilus assembly ATPase PilB [Gammaproteobacteria bacterium]